MNRLILIVLVIFVFTSCAPYRPACQTKAGKQKIQYYNSIQYQKSTKYSKNKSTKKRVAVY
jgi:hypothetical protein